MIANIRIAPPLACSGGAVGSGDGAGTDTVGGPTGLGISGATVACSGGAVGADTGTDVGGTGLDTIAPAVAWACVAVGAGTSGDEAVGGTAANPGVLALVAGVGVSSGSSLQADSKAVTSKHASQTPTTSRTGFPITLPKRAVNANCRLLLCLAAKLFDAP